MNTYQIESITIQLNRFTKDLTNKELVELTRYICYGATEEVFKKPHKIAQDFIDEFFGEFTWAKMVSDERDTEKIFMSASMTERDLVRHMKIALMQQAFFRLVDVVNSNTVDKPKIDKPSKEDKQNLNDILTEHKAMLEYQLEDEDYVKKVGGQELVDEKKRHLSFIKKTVK